MLELMRSERCSSSSQLYVPPTSTASASDTAAPATTTADPASRSSNERLFSSPMPVTKIPSNRNAYTLNGNGTKTHKQSVGIQCDISGASNQNQNNQNGVANGHVMITMNGDVDHDFEAIEKCRNLDENHRLVPKSVSEKL